MPGPFPPWRLTRPRRTCSAPLTVRVAIGRVAVEVMDDGAATALTPRP
jgi:hypothetical protein